MKLHSRDRLFGMVLALGLVLAACSAKSSDDDDDGVGGSGQSGSLGGNANPGQGGAGNDLTGGRAPTGGRATGGNAATTGGATSLVELKKACPGFPVDPNASTTEDGGVWRATGMELEPSPLDMMIAMDRTMSMTYCMDGRHDDCIPDTASEPMRWEVLQQGLEQFLANIATLPASAQPRMGLRFFGELGYEDPAECSPQTFFTPAVPIQSFETASPAITQAMNVMKPNLGGQTPWQPALWGVLQYAQDWQKNHPERVTVVLFVTDGYPTICETDMNKILTTIGEFYWGLQGEYNALGKPGIRTYILGVGSEFGEAPRYNLDLAASAGGTGEASIANNAAQVEALGQAMRNISNSKVECDFAIPPPPDGQIMEKDKVQVIYKPFSGAPQEIGKASSAGGCSSANGGWYFDNEANPTRVILCECSCANLGAGRINVQFGCRPKPIIG